ncbi:MAG: DUF4167 domain-containing protein [Oricola sp.]|jgi:hypothetical protein|nr:DUF4167 domain-containing protein [Oricola sp.]
MKRGRNQRRRPGGPNPNRALDSNGPDVRIRGTANQIYDKYLALARDASSSGDRVKAESYLQHAEHYFRLIRAMQPAQQPNQQPGGQDVDADQPGYDDGDTDQPEARQPQPREERNNNNNHSSAASAPEAEDGEDNAPAQADAKSGDAEEERKPRRRRQPRRAQKTDDADKTPAAAAE